MQRLEQHDVVHPVEELRTETGPQLPHDVMARLFADIPGRGDPLDQVRGADVGGHDDDRVLEIDRTPLTVCHPAIVQYLQQDVEHIRMGLFDFIEEQDAVRLAAHRLGQLSSFFIADIAGRSADQARYGKLLHVFRHIDAHHVVFRVEQSLGQRTGQLGFADPGRSQEDERADGAVWILDAGAGPEHRIRNEPHRLVLADHPLMEDIFQPQQFLPFPFHQPHDRDTGPMGHDFGDFVFGDLLAQQFLAALIHCQFRLFIFKSRFQARQFRVL